MKYTLKELESKSDFEISKLVAEKEGVRWHINPSHPLNNTDGWIFYTSGTNGDTTLLPDYCNSWADIGPIIEHEGVSLIKWPNKEEYEASIAIYYGHGVIDAEIYYSHTNPLRAAAIVYLLMED